MSSNDHSIARRMVRCMMLCATFVYLAAAGDAVAQVADAARDFASSRVGRRVVKLFDFDEEKLGNAEPLPMFWAMQRGAGFPGYLEGRFDKAVGHEATPSYYLGLHSGNVGSYYEGRDIDVRPESDYRVIAWVRSDRLEHARIRLSAYYMDHAQQKIVESEQYSALVDETRAKGEWRRVVIDLPGGFAQARWMGLSFAVLQPSKLDAESPDATRSIRREDALGGAWIDDIVVLRLPRLELSHDRRPALYRHDEPVGLNIGIEDPDGIGLTASLVVTDADGMTVLERDIPVASGGSSVETVDLSQVRPGWYASELTLSGNGKALMRRRASFVRMAPDIRRIPDDRGIIGTILDTDAAIRDPATLELLRALSAGVVKIPLWTRDLTPQQLADGDPVRDRALVGLRQAGIRVAAMLAEPPEALASQYDAHHRGLLDILSGDPEPWRPYLSLLLARHSQTISFWQIGRDGDESIIGDVRWPTAIDNVRREIMGLTSLPVMSAPWNATFALDADAVPSQFLSLWIGNRIPATAVNEQVELFGALGYNGVWAVIEPIDARYDAATQLNELAKRMVTAMAGGADMVFFRPPWIERTDRHTSFYEPAPEFAVIRTLAQAVGGAETREMLPGGSTATVWMFTDADGRGTVIAWRRTHDNATILPHYLAGLKQFDLFGRPVDDDTPLSERPRIFTGADAATVWSLASIRFAETRVGVSTTLSDNAIVMKNHRNQTMLGRLDIRSPRGWTIKPESIDFSVEAGGEVQLPVRMRIPMHQPSEDVQISCTLTISGKPPITTEVRLPLRVALADMETMVTAQMRDGALFVRQRVTNLSPETLDLELYLLAPDQPRMSRLVRGLRPGETVVRSYRLDSPQSLRGKAVRAGLSQIDGPRRSSELVPVD